VPNRLLAVSLISAMLAGCQNLQDYLPSGDQPASRENIRISFYSGSSTPGGSRTHDIWEFQPTGECHLSHRHSWNRGEQAPEKWERNWQSKTDYEKCVKLLRQTRFFEMNQKFPEVLPGGSSEGITIQFRWKTHVVSYPSSEPRPEAISQILEFLDEPNGNSLPPPLAKWASHDCQTI
jgi:hypothetical protein